MNDLNRPMTFMELVKECRKIEIPLIQRDYAQGRDAESVVRDAFLDALHEKLALPPGDPSLPLNLDFIYGSLQKNDTGDVWFEPLDGQQRLTTLCLLHWYAGWKDGKLADFRQRMTKGGRSLFTYRVRPSSREFFAALHHFEPQRKPNQEVSLRRVIEDQAWFFLYWRLDPTIDAALDMLDAIHRRFLDSSALYERLTDETTPSVTFQLLQLTDFGLSDELYIKMNARGRPLTTFETFKATFQEHLKDLFVDETIGAEEWPVWHFFANQMDTQWTDLFGSPSDLLE
jgi:hypothetical protein